VEKLKCKCSAKDIHYCQDLNVTDKLETRTEEQTTSTWKFATENTQNTFEQICRNHVRRTQWLAQQKSKLDMEFPMRKSRTEFQFFLQKTDSKV